MKRPTILNTEHLPRLFVDMDGTIAEWRNLSINVTAEEEAKSMMIEQKLNEILYSPDYFLSLAPQQNVIDAVRYINNNKLAEVFISSCVMPDKDGISPTQQKQDYIDKYLPEIDKDHRIFVPDGEDKKAYIPGGVKEDDYLLDDFTKNLVRWETPSSLPGTETKEIAGKGIKLLNQVNSRKNTWTGSKISYHSKPLDIVFDIAQIMYLDKTIIQHDPDKNRSSISAEDFLKNISDLRFLERRPQKNHDKEDKDDDFER